MGSRTASATRRRGPDATVSTSATARPRDAGRLLDPDLGDEDPSSWTPPVPPRPAAWTRWLPRGRPCLGAARDRAVAAVKADITAAPRRWEDWSGNDGSHRPAPALAAKLAGLVAPWPRVRVSRIGAGGCSITTQAARAARDPAGRSDQYVKVTDATLDRIRLHSVSPSPSVLGTVSVRRAGRHGHRRRRCGCSPPRSRAVGLVGAPTGPPITPRALGEVDKPTRLTSDIIIRALGALGTPKSTRRCPRAGISFRRRSPGTGRLAGGGRSAPTA